MYVSCRVAFCVGILALISGAIAAVDPVEEKFTELNEERDEVFNHIVETLKQVTAHGEALEKRLKSMQEKLDKTTESLAKCTEEKQKMTSGVPHETYNRCVEENQATRTEYERTVAELIGAQAELQQVKKSTETCARGAACSQELEQLRHKHDELLREHSFAQAALSNAQRRLQHSSAFTGACEQLPQTMVAAADMRHLKGSEAVNFWGWIAALCVLFVLVVGMNKQKTY